MSTAIPMDEEITENSEAAKPASEAKPAKKKGGGKTKLLLILGSLLAMGFFRTGFLFIVVALLPTIIMHYVDRSRLRYKFKTIRACNVSGLLPFIAEMIKHGPTSSVLERIMSDPLSWMIVYGASLFGLLLVRITPHIAHAFISQFHSSQANSLKDHQNNIEKEWGDEVTQFSEQEKEKGFYL